MNPADWAWLAAPALALTAACLVLAPLGTQVLARGVVFIDLAVAQAAACGALAAAALTDHPPVWQATGAAALASLAGAGAVWWLARRWPAQREALIGLLYVACASAALAGAAWDPHGRERLAALLAADVLWAPWSGAVLLLAAAAGVQALMLLSRGALQRDAVFYPLFAVVLSIAVPLLGVYLVFALLIAPALWVRRGLGLAQACLLALGACAAGIGGSWVLDWPSGACIALALCAMGLAACHGTEGKPA